MARGETKVCPVCDSVIDVAAQRCSECNTDLSLFDVDADGIPNVSGPPVQNGKAIDDILKSIVGNKEIHPDVFEDIKTIGTNQGATDDVLAGVDVQPGIEFECPNCGTRVAGQAKRCPGCGVMFADETVEEFECPLCNAIVDVDASSCPSCGVKFADEQAVADTAGSASTGEAPGLHARPPPPSFAAAPMERLWSLVESRRAQPTEEIGDATSLYKELPRLVNEVKPLLITAKKVGVDIGPEKDLISEAIAHGKKRDVEKAVRLIRRARFQLEQSFTTQIAKRVEDVVREAERARATGGEVGRIVALCEASIEALERRDYAGAGEQVHNAQEEFDIRSGGYMKAREQLEAAQALLEDSQRLGIEFRDAASLLTRAEASLTRRDWDEAAGHAVEARQAMLRTLPDALSREMKRARDALLDMKVRGIDLTKPVGILKQASIHIKRSEYPDAVRFVRMFRDEIGS